MWVPAGYAHGFAVLSDEADFLYKTTDYYAPAAEITVRWDDPELAIDWPKAAQPFTLAERDAKAPFLAQLPAIE